MLYVATEDWFFHNHFLPMARAARAAGFETHLAARVGARSEDLRRAGVVVHPLAGERRQLGPARLIGEVVALTRVMRRVRPDVCHLIALKPVVLGGLAARLAAVPGIVAAVTGLGWLAAAPGAKARAMRAAVRWSLRRLLAARHTRLLVENPDDATPLIAALPELAERTVLVGGAGVDPDAFPALPQPAGPPVAALVARMLWSKGVDVAVDAQTRLRARGLAADLRLVGAPDPQNPRAVPEADLAAWRALPGVAWAGPTSDIQAVWRAAAIALVPSRGGEGLPRALLEAAACGRPIVTTDVPGCRLFVRDGVEGRVVAPGDPEALADAWAGLVADAGMRARMGAAARARLLDGFTEEAVTGRVVALYRSLLGDSASSTGSNSKVASKA